MHSYMSVYVGLETYKFLKFKYTSGCLMYLISDF